MLYPLKFEPVYKNMIWGGRNIEKKFKRYIPEGTIGESWEVCCRSDGMSVISNGYLKDSTLSSVIDKYKEHLLGTRVYNTSYKVFPLLIKIIDANDNLSVQVHPDDEYAFKKSGENGKTEMWYVIDAKPGAKLVYGLKNNITKHDFTKAISNNNIENTLNEVEVHKGDVFYIPAGTVHAILDGILIAEIQQNSNTTYRVSDWNRVDSSGKSRELHLCNALEVINFNSMGIFVPDDTIYDFGTYKLKTLSKNAYFTTEEILLNGKYRAVTDNFSFFIYMVIEGYGQIKYNDGIENISSGDTIMIPATLGNYEIIGEMKLLKVYV